MGLVASDVFIHNLKVFRSCWFRGRYGGGKTLLSVALADLLHKKHDYNVFANIPVHVDGVIPEMALCDGTSPRCDEGCKMGYQKYHTVVVYDEAWMALGLGMTSMKAIAAYLAYLRKFDLIMLLPSVQPMARNSYMLWCERKMNLGTMGIPYWAYEWGLPRKSAKDSGGSFGFLLPNAYFGKYDTHTQADDMEAFFTSSFKKKRKL